MLPVNEMRLPGLLIIGAMKSGTTGVFMDLCRHPGVFAQDNKEPHCLRQDEVLTAAGRQAYAQIFAGAREDQLLCDASTGYSKRPDNEGIVDRAMQVLQEGFRVIYIVREPIDRIISQHYHEFIAGMVPACIDTVVREHPRFVNYSRYGYQLQPWIEALGPERVRVVRFETYKADRLATIQGLCEFAGLDPQRLPREADQVVYNQNDGKPLIDTFWRRVKHSSVYQRAVRPLLPVRLRHHLQRAVLPKAPDRPAPPTAETCAWLKSQLAGDVRQISQYAGSAELLWEDWHRTGQQSVSR